METKFIEAHGNGFNWGKFMVAKFTPEDWDKSSDVTKSKSLLKACGWDYGHILVVDLQTGEGSIFRHGGFASADLNTKHQIWVCPLFEPFLTWLYTQDVSNLENLPSSVELQKAEAAIHGYRRTRQRNL
jgi:hypothetical protein